MQHQKLIPLFLLSILISLSPTQSHSITQSSRLSATLFQTTGSDRGTDGFVNITDLKGGKIQFGQETPYNSKVIQIRKLLPSDVTAAPTPSPTDKSPTVISPTGVMSAKGCKIFADILSANPDAEQNYQSNVEGGLTVFCPLDDPMKAFLPKYNNLTAAGKSSFLQFLAIPIYNSMPMLKSNNGPTNTLATDGNSYGLIVQNEGETVTLKTKVNTVKLTGTLIDEEPLAIYSTDTVLLPKELFKPALTPAPAPAPVPKPSKTKKKKAPKPADSPADSPDGDVADQKANKNSGVSLDGGRRVVAAILSFGFAVLLL